MWRGLPKTETEPEKTVTVEKFILLQYHSSHLQKFDLAPFQHLGVADNKEITFLILCSWLAD
jgi:hypothetical protein